MYLKNYNISGDSFYIHRYVYRICMYISDSKIVFSYGRSSVHNVPFVLSNILISPNIATEHFKWDW